MVYAKTRKKPLVLFERLNLLNHYIYAHLYAPFFYAADKTIYMYTYIYCFTPVTPKRETKTPKSNRFTLFLPD